MGENGNSGGKIVEKFRKIIYKIAAMAAILMFFYVLYLAALIKDYPKMKKEINVFHDVVTEENAGQTGPGAKKFMVSGEGIKEKIEEIKKYKKVLGNKSMEIAGFISGLKSGGNKVKEEKERLEKMIDDILEAYESYRGQAGEKH